MDRSYRRDTQPRDCLRDNMKQYILVIAAVQGELEPLMENMINTQTGRVGQREVLTGRLREKDVLACVTGPGQNNAVQALTAVIENHPPWLIVQTGCGGAFKGSGLKIGDVGIATEEIDVHLGLENGDPQKPVKALPFPVLTGNSAGERNKWMLNEKWVDDAFMVLSRPEAGDRFQIKKGPFVTTQTITATDQRADDLFQWYQPVLEAMEGAGCAQVAALYGLPFIEIRSASNYVGTRNEKEWNLPLAFNNGCRAVMDYIAHMGHPCKSRG